MLILSGTSAAHLNPSKLPITSQMATDHINHMPLYRIDTSRLSEKIQHLEETKGVLLASSHDTSRQTRKGGAASSPLDHKSRNGWPSPGGDDDAAARDSSCNYYTISQIKNCWFLIVAGCIFLFYILLLQYLHIHKLSVYIFGFIFTIVVCFLYRRQEEADYNESIAGINHFGYESI
jgi:hypothetical protein